MDTDHKYRISRHSPSPTHRDRDEVVLPGHRMGYTKRKDILIPPGKGGVDYNAWCICGWVDQEYRGLGNKLFKKWVTKRQLTSRYVVHHINHVRDQGVLRV